MRRRSKSVDEIQNLVKELHLSEETFINDVDGGTDNSIGTASSTCRVGKREGLANAVKKEYRKISNHNNSKKNTRPKSAPLLVAKSIRLPLKAFTVDNLTEIQNPPLFLELYSMAFTSASIFALAEVRQAARNGKIDNTQLDIISTPVATGSIVKAFDRNQKFFQSNLSPDVYEFLVSLTRITDIDAALNAEDGKQDQKKKALAFINSLSIDYFGDDNAQSQCLYMITRSPVTKRIALIFRGSTTIQDWIKDSKFIVSDIENPVSDRPNQLPMIGIHKGFREYLYGESRTVTTEASCESKTSASISGKTDETIITSTTHNLQQQPTTLVAENEGNDDGDESLIQPDCTEKAPMNSKNENHKDSSTGDDNLFNVTTKQEDQKSISDLLNNLGLDLSSIKEKQKQLWNRVWSENEDVSESEKSSSGFLTKLTAPRNRGKNKSRLERILDEIRDIQRQYDDYRIYIAGHSLGGALGLLTALEVAVRFGKVGQPVTFVGIGNPRAGTEGFRDAVEVLEQEGKMRCISIHGHYDIVPMLPSSAFNRLNKRRFCQSGFELILNSELNKFYMRRSERSDYRYIQRFGLALLHAIRIQERHHYVTYLKELEALQKPLKKLYLNDFYDKFLEQSVFPCSKMKMTPMKVRAARGRESVFIMQAPSERTMKRALSAVDLRVEKMKQIEDNEDIN